MKGLAPKFYRMPGAALLLATSPVAAEPLIVDNGRLFIRANADVVETEALLDSAAGTSVLKSFHITTDSKQRSVWLRAVGKPGQTIETADDRRGRGQHP